jgi:hypothetical protein
MIYNAMFPRNEQPQGLHALMEKFMHVGEIHRYIRLQLVAGAKVARFLPAPPGGVINMEPHYAAARIPAIRIIRHLLGEDQQFFTNFTV